jgi:hypothetical protein
MNEKKAAAAAGEPAVGFRMTIGRGFPSSRYHGAGAASVPTKRKKVCIPSE